MNFYRLLCHKILWAFLNMPKKPAKNYIKTKNCYNITWFFHSCDKHFNMHKATSAPQYIPIGARVNCFSRLSLIKKGTWKFYMIRNWFGKICVQFSKIPVTFFYNNIGLEHTHSTIWSTPYAEKVLYKVSAFQICFCFRLLVKEKTCDLSCISPL